MSDREEYHDSHVGDTDSENEEVVFKTTTATLPTAPSQLITRSDLEEIIEGWQEKFRKLTEGMRAIEQATEEVHTHMEGQIEHSVSAWSAPTVYSCQERWKHARKRTLFPFRA